jgi:hypothetical protein
MLTFFVLGCGTFHLHTVHLPVCDLRRLPLPDFSMANRLRRETHATDRILHFFLYMAFRDSERRIY